MNHPLTLPASDHVQNSHEFSTAKTRLLLFSMALFSLVAVVFILKTSNKLAFATFTQPVWSSQTTTPPSYMDQNSNLSTFTGNKTNDVATVVAKALAFKALLTSAQQTTLEKTYTPTLARRWSNLPCGSGCRNGVQFSTLTAAQLSAALEVIQAAAGTGTEGYNEFEGIRAADAYLNANGGGNGYGSGIYFIAFLNTPTTTGSWMLQYGGHHYGANIAFKDGQVVGTTPQFEGVEPAATFTVSRTSYAPLAEEHSTMAAMLASLTTAQLATAKLNSTYSDVTMSPGESNGGNGTFPITKVGVAVSTLNATQQALVLAAMAPWVNDIDDASAATLLSVYQNELSGTYIAYTGNGTSGNASSFLNTNTNYARIDGPSVWIEFICQNGIVLSGIHYHSVWRDHTRDYGADLSNTTLPVTTLKNAAIPLSVFPNPANNQLHLILPADLGKSSLKVMDTNGKTVMFNADYNGTNDLNISALTAGHYFIVIENKEYSYAGKFVKQ